MIDYSQYADGADLNWYEADRTMHHYVRRYLDAALREWGEERLRQLGAHAAGPMERRARHTDRDGQPRLIRYDRDGREISQVWYNEGYLATVGDGFETGVVGWRYAGGLPCKVPFFYTQLLHMLMSMAEVGFTCPVTLTMAVAFVLERFGSQEQRERWLPGLASMDRRTLLQGGTFLTEREGGSDVGAIVTRAVPNGDHYLLTGEKWFASNCDADVALVLARVGDTPGTRGLGLFLVPRLLDDGRQNGITIRRLKDKLGVRAVASGELELNGAVGYPVGDLRDGFKMMAEALNISRLCTATGSLAISRRALLEAAVYTSRRVAFGAPLAHFPLVQQQLLDMAVDIEANWALAAQTMLAFDRLHTYGTADGADELRVRLLLAMAKYRLSENAVQHARMALELHGGNGYIEDFVTPRLLRDAQVNTVWEGPSNIMGLELLKTLAREARGSAGGESVLLRDVRMALGRVRDARLAGAAAVVREAVPLAASDVAALLEAPAGVQNLHARRLLDKLTDLYSAAHLLEEAQHSLDSDGSDRLARIASYYADRLYRPERLGVGGDAFSPDLFRAAVCYAGL